MTDYRNILRLYSQGHSQREMERELQCSRHTISAVLVQAAAVGVSWPLDDSVTNEDLQEILFPGRYAYASPYTVPDFRYIHEELAKKGVTLTLLWEEYCQRIRSTGGVSYMYTQFCEKNLPPLGPRDESHHAYLSQTRRRYAGRLGRRSAVHYGLCYRRSDACVYLRGRSALQLVHLRRGLQRHEAGALASVPRPRLFVLWRRSPATHSGQL